MAKFLTKNEIEKDFADTFRSLAYVHSGWTVHDVVVFLAAKRVNKKGGRLDRRKVRELRYALTAMGWSDVDDGGDAEEFESKINETEEQ